MSIVTLNTQCLTFTFKYSKHRPLTQSSAELYDFNFYTDGKGNILTMMDDPSWLHCDCEKKTVWSNLPGISTPEYNDVIDAVKDKYPAVHAYIMATRRNHDDANVLLEQALVSLPVVTVPMRTAIRMEKVNHKGERGTTKLLGVDIRVNQNFGWEARSLLGWRFVGFTGDGSLAPVYTRKIGSLPAREYQMFDDVRSGILVMHYGYSADSVADPADKLAVAVKEIRDILEPHDKVKIYSVRVRADGAVRIYPRHQASGKWMSKLEIPEEAMFIFAHGLEHALRPLGTPELVAYPNITFKLPTDKYYMRYLVPTLSGSVRTVNTRHGIYFTLDAEGKAQWVKSFTDLAVGTVVYKLSSSMRQQTNNHHGSVTDSAKHVLSKRGRNSEKYLGFYSCFMYMVDQDHRLTGDLASDSHTPMGELTPATMSRILAQYKDDYPDHHAVITFENLTA